MGMIPGNIIEISYAENIMMRMILDIMMGASYPENIMIIMILD